MMSRRSVVGSLGGSLSPRWVRERQIGRSGVDPGTQIDGSSVDIPAGAWTGMRKTAFTALHLPWGSRSTITITGGIDP
jgi:hypothetical protein